MIEAMSKTIAAAATPMIPSAIGIVRISGPDAKPLLDAVFRPVKKSRGIRPRRACFGGMYSREGLKIDEGLAVYMPGPGSYTGEDTAELYCHGSPGVIAALLEALFAHGAVQAQPGEFTRRAFLNGRMDLSQSEAVIDLIESETKSAAANAAAQVSGVLGKQLGAVREDLVSIAAWLSAMMDFPEEEVPELEMEALSARLAASTDFIKKLRQSYGRGAYIKNGVPCAITGKPNVGKSSLLNALAGFQRAIVTDIPGTTRDVVEQTVLSHGIKLSFFDTAGIRDTEDAVERIGVARARDTVKSAAAVLAVFDLSNPLSGEDRTVMENAANAASAGAAVWCVLNKCDLPREMDDAVLRQMFPRVFELSASDGRGVDALLSSITAYFGDNQEAAESLITNPRQADALSRAEEALGRALLAIKTLTADVVCTDVEQAADILGEITGHTASEEIIAEIFLRFCVGK